MTNDKKLYRIIDANFNRAKEGLRVCEDICRFFYNKKIATRKYKDIRHRLTGIVETPRRGVSTGLRMEEMIKARDIDGDIGRKSSSVEFRRRDVEDIFYANSQRVKESLRVLEEFAKLVDGRGERPFARTAEKIKKLRYQIYALEQEVGANPRIRPLKGRKHGFART